MLKSTMNKITITATVRFEGVPDDKRPGYVAQVRRALETLTKNQILWRPLRISTSVVVCEEKEAKRG